MISSKRTGNENLQNTRNEVFEEMTWEQTAVKIGRKATENGLEKKFERFMKKN